MANENDDVLEQIVGESSGERIVRAARFMVGCSATVDPDRYVRTMIRPVDRETMRASYLQNARLSTCQLLQEAACRMAGAGEECEAHEPLDGQIGTRQRAQCNRYDAWIDVPATSGFDLAALIVPGRGFWIDEVIRNADGTVRDNVHAGIFVSAPTKIDDNTIDVDTVEGGQLKIDDGNADEKAIGYTAQKKFRRRFNRKGNRWYLGNGSRYVIAVQAFEKLAIPFTVPVERVEDAPALDVGPTGAAVRGEG